MTESDGRRARGDLTRHTAARQAAMTATVTGLESVTLGALAAQTGLSKSGILTVFGSRDAVLLAAIGEARTIFVNAVIMPAFAQPRGSARLRALVDAWFGYVRDGIFPGGCFLYATCSEFSGQEGPIAAAVSALKTEWIQTLSGELSAAGSTEPDDDAFLMDAIFGEANMRFQLLGDEAELRRGHRLAHLLADRLAGVVRLSATRQVRPDGDRSMG